MNRKAHYQESSIYSHSTEKRKVFAYCGYVEKANRSNRTANFVGDKSAAIDVCVECIARALVDDY